ncbi:MAG TPA: hypothetical protein VG942_07720 [Hyphomonadaceae bacterium]|nr:hypothetical protein [Hyphomonadaceae bacterium]
MHKVSSALAACGLAILAASCGSTGKPDKDGIVRGPAPYGALTSGEEALKIIFDQVCLPTVLDGGDFITLAKSHYLIETAAAKDSTGQSSRTFELASLAHASAALWADGTCTISIQRGDSEKYRTQILAALAARGQAMKQGTVASAANDGVNTAYCNPDPRPLLLGVIVPGSPKSKRSAIVANLYRAKGGASDICMR